MLWPGVAPISLPMKPTMPKLSHPTPPWLILLFGCGCVLVTLAGCQGSASSTPVDFSQQELPGDDELRDMIDEVLDFTLHDRRLSSP